jgi:hypothetical protein
MALPGRLRVKLSTEAAGWITLTPVVVQEMSLAELAEVIVNVTGKDATRIREILKRGSFTSGATRFRWEPVIAEAGEVEALLALISSPSGAQDVGDQGGPPIGRD